MIGKITAALMGAWVALDRATPENVKNPFRVLLLFILIDLILCLCTRKACPQVTLPKIAFRLYVKVALYGGVCSLFYGMSLLTGTPLFVAICLTMLCGVEAMQVWEVSADLAECQGVNMGKIFSLLKVAGTQVFQQPEEKKPPES